MVEILTLALMRGHSLMTVWQTGSQLWQILLSHNSADELSYNKLSNTMTRLVVSCDTEDAKIMFESLLSGEVGIVPLYLPWGY